MHAIKLCGSLDYAVGRNDKLTP